jgi:predicted CXXCH cytochrome family protein
MKGRTVPTNQHDLYVKSVHGRALLEKGDVSAPACNDCHGNHGAVPPQTRDISIVCGTCHGREGELFAASAVKEQLDLEGKRGCVTCHGNHGVQLPTDAMMSNGPEGLCSRCHQPGSAGARATERIVPRFHALRAKIAAAESTLTVADRRGMETSGGRDLLKQAGDALVDVRVVFHSFDPKRIDEALTAGAGLADRAHAEGLTALKDWRNRRVGMAASLGAILVMIALLVLKIRQVESS